MRFFVTGIGTEVGKTVVSAVLVQALEAGYWKPVQAGGLDRTDSDRIRELTSCTRVYPERYALTRPISPHAAAASDGARIDIDAFSLPEEKKPLIVEGAGGVLVPLNDVHLMIDLIVALELPAIVVCRHYLGSINHTLLTLEALRSRSIPIHGIIYSGDRVSTSETIIERHFPVRDLGRVPELSAVDPDAVRRASATFVARDLWTCETPTPR